MYTLNAFYFRIATKISNWIVFILLTLAMNSNTLSTSKYHYSTTGYICEAYNNPPDFFLDVVNGSVKKQGEEDEDSGKKGQEKNGSRPASKASLNTTQNEDGSVSVFVDPDMHTGKDYIRLPGKHHTVHWSQSSPLR